MSWRILITDKLDPAGVDRLRRDAEVVQQDSLSQLDQFDALIVRGATKVRAADIENARPGLKVIGRSGVGVDNIDLQAARAHHVTVVNAPLAATNAVVELALGLMFALARHLPRADTSMKAGEWAKKSLRGQELDGKTLGVIGMGRIGATLGQRAAALGMSVLGHDPPLDDEEIRRRGARPVSLDDLLEQSDYISVHVPLLESTRGLLGREEFGRAKFGARIVCTARGGVVDEEALLEALESGQVAGAALDVFSEEPPGRSELVGHPNLIATPHIGAQTAEAQERAALDIAEEVLAALEGRSLRWRVA